MPRFRICQRGALALLAALLLTSQPGHADVKVVTSIKPLELLVRAVAPEVQVTTLVPPGSSPHTYSLRPSQRQALSEADAIFWIGPDMETFLERLLTSTDFRQRSHALQEAIPGMEDNEGSQDHDAHEHEHEERAHHEDEDEHEAHDEHAHHEEEDEHGAHDEHAHHEEEEEHEGHGHHHDHGDHDPHLWVDPALALDMARQIRDTLRDMNVLDAQQLDKNLASFEAAMAEKESTIREQLRPLADISLFAYHSALTHFAEHYELNLAGILTLNPDVAPGARRVRELKQTLAAANHPCLLTEPQFNRQWWHSITEGVEVTLSVWDPLATDIPATADGYLLFQQSIADAVSRCLP